MVSPTSNGHLTVRVWCLILVGSPTSKLYLFHQEDPSLTFAERLGDEEEIFAVQWNGIHQVARSGDIVGIRYQDVG